MNPARQTAVALVSLALWGSNAYAIGSSSGALEEAMQRLRSSRKIGGDSATGARPVASNTPVSAAEAPLFSSAPTYQVPVAEVPMPQDVGGQSETPGTAVNLPARRRRRLRELRVSLDWVPLRMTQNQAAGKSTSFISVGRRIDTSVSFLPGNNVRENREEKAGAMGVFLGEAAMHLYGIRLKVLSYTGKDGMRMDGMTPKVGRVRLVQVREVGDVRGKTVAEVDGVAFALGGRETVIPIDVATDPRARYMVVLSLDAPEGTASAINVPVSTEGTYPALPLDPKNFVPRRQDKPFFDAPIVFEYKPDPGVVRPNAIIEGDFLKALEDYLENNPTAEHVPLKLLLE